MPNANLTVRLAAYQGQCVQGDPDANLATVQRVIEEAGGQGTDFLCFPETFLSGYGDRGTVERGALCLDDPRLVALGEQAQRHDLVLLVGLAERMPNNRLGNTVAIFADGERLGVYRKTMLTRGDATTMGFCPGDDLPVFTAKGVTFGCIVCADSSYVEPAGAMAYQGASLLFSPHYNAIQVSGMDAHRVRVRTNHAGLATLLDLYVVRANVVGTDRPGLLGYGDSAIFAPDGRVLAEAGLFREALIFAEAELTPERAAGRSQLRQRVPPTVRERLAAAMRTYPVEPDRR